MNEQIIEFIISILPSIIAVLTTVGVIFKTIREFKALKKEVTDMKSIEVLKSDLREVLQENRELKRQMNQTLSKIDHIHRGE